MELLLLGVAAAVLAGCSSNRTPSRTSLALLPPPVVTPGPDYRLQLGDSIKVQFLYQPENDMDLVVRPDGRISLSPAGEVDAVGKTERELEQIITERASEHLREPKVTVTVTKVGPQNIYVAGEVLHPGVVTLVPGMTPLQAVMEQGGFVPTAKRDSVVLILPTADGKFAASRINLEQVLTDGVPERVRLRPNAVIFVPKTWVAHADDVVDLYVRGLIPALPRVGVRIFAQQRLRRLRRFQFHPQLHLRVRKAQSPGTHHGLRAARRIVSTCPQRSEDRLRIVSRQSQVLGR